MSHVDDYPSRSPAGPSRVSASPSNPFANLHSDLHGASAGQAQSSTGAGSGSGSGAAVGGSSTGAGHSGRSMSPNRLTDFAQHVLGVNTINPEEIIQVMNGSHAGDHGRAHGHHSHHDDVDDAGEHAHGDGRNRHHGGGGGVVGDDHLHGGEDTRGDAENLLAFTGTQESFLPGGQGFEGLMSEAAGLDLGRQHLDGGDGRDDVEGSGGLMMDDDDGRNAAMQGHHGHHPSQAPLHQQRRGKRRREVDTIDGVELDPIRMKKDSHKEVERRRRDQINDGIMEIIKIVPGLAEEKIGKGLMLHKAAAYMTDLMLKANTIDKEISKRDEEKDELRAEIALLQQRLTEEHERSIRFETSWREAEDRVAASQFELERLR